ncbi:hypothetical protein EUTSA_v10028826mg [Eutrema salsugineum]|uniref:DUF6821 domain-containing protein n=1 Tax=Eutrema salsugineum TaxID=72664 RepID=V4LFN1_EUTSA|nr:ATG8-interacting protein 2 [Eutrema salsugineum]ESQ38558.1 hypothetical protein EUTSA_v10028826mg [Eutrema salsugineum]
MEDELLDWELLHGSDTESTDSITSEKKSGSSNVIDDGMILSDHFSADNLINRSGQTTDPTQYAVSEPDNSFRVESGSNQRQNPGEDRFDSRSGDACVGSELNDSKNGISCDGEVMASDYGAVDEEKNVESETVAESTEDGSKFVSGSNDLKVDDASQSGVEDSSESRADSEGNEMVSGDSGIVNGENDIVSDSDVVAVRSGDESKSRETVWWKMPFVLVKYCAFRIGPVWSVSMAAAVMGLVLLGRRLYNMKKKAQRFHLKVTIDDKKVSRVMSQAARLNEVFTEVRRVPVIRPALPSPGAWPVLSLR